MKQRGYCLEHRGGLNAARPSTCGTFPNHPAESCGSSASFCPVCTFGSHGKTGETDLDRLSPGRS